MVNLETIRKQNQVMFKFLFPIVILIGCMTLQRFLFHIAFLSGREFYYEVTPLEIFQIYFSGFRFDLLVWGFFLLPFWLLCFFENYLSSKFYRGMIDVYWFLIFFITSLDLPFFSKFKVHLNLPEAMVYHHHVWNGDVNPFNNMYSFAFLVIIYLIGLSAIHRDKQSQLFKKVDAFCKHKKGEAFLRWLVPLFAIVFLMRGTLGAHHLRREDSEMTEFRHWNELGLNSVWSIGKDDR